MIYNTWTNYRSNLNLNNSNIARSFFFLSEVINNKEEFCPYILFYSVT